MPRLSIVIPSYSRADLLRVCLQRVHSHAPEGTEVLVVDDASENHLISRTASSFPKVRVLRRDRRKGFCATVNTGLAVAQGEIVELLNDDTEVQPRWADEALACFADPRVGAVAPLVLSWPDGSRVDSAGDGYSLGGVARKLQHGQAIDAAGPHVRNVFGANGTAGFFRRAALEQVGNFPEHFGSYFEDIDLAFRLRRAGWGTLFQPSSRVLHHVSASFGRRGRRLLQMQSRNEERVFLRHLGGLSLSRSLLPHLAVLLGKMVRRYDEGTLIPWFVGRLQAWSEIIQIAQQRHEMAKFTTNPDWRAWQVNRSIV